MSLDQFYKPIWHVFVRNLYNLILRLGVLHATHTKSTHLRRRAPGAGLFGGFAS